MSNNGSRCPTGTLTDALDFQYGVFGFIYRGFSLIERGGRELRLAMKTSLLEMMIGGEDSF